MIQVSSNFNIKSEIIIEIINILALYKLIQILKILSKQ